MGSTVCSMFKFSEEKIDPLSQYLMDKFMTCNGCLLENNSFQFLGLSQLQQLFMIKIVIRYLNLAKDTETLFVCVPSPACY